MTIKVAFIHLKQCLVSILWHALQLKLFKAGVHGKLQPITKEVQCLKVVYLQGLFGFVSTR